MGSTIISASAEQLVILFNQLFANSIQFKSSNRTLKIAVVCNKVSGKNVVGLPPEIKAPSYHHVQFTDNGIGFEEAFKDKMFKPFQRLHNYDVENEVRHKGMGLAICKRVMLNLGGWIDANGKVDAGTIIHLYFPII